jgi:hypothetical protein
MGQRLQRWREVVVYVPADRPPLTAARIWAWAHHGVRLPAGYGADFAWNAPSDLVEVPSAGRVAAPMRWWRRLFPRRGPYDEWPDPVPCRDCGGVMTRMTDGLGGNWLQCPVDGVVYAQGWLLLQWIADSERQ